MLTETFQRLIWANDSNAPKARAEVGPSGPQPGAPRRARGWRNSLRTWLLSGWHPSSYGEGARPDRRTATSNLTPVREALLATLQDIRTQEAGLLQERLRIARSLRELWHLRPEVFRLVALHFSQSEAERRLAHSNRHFPGHSPRSGFSPLDA